MPTFTAPLSWQPAGAALAPFGRQLLVQGQPGRPAAFRWLLKRNCSLGPQQLGSFYLTLCAVSLFISIFFMVQGAPWVLFFAGLELLAVGLALLVFARHAADREQLTLVGSSLQVEQHFGSQVQRTDLMTECLTIEPVAGQGSLVRLSSRGQTLHVGRYLRPELRAAFAQELRLALRQRLLAPGNPIDAAATPGAASASPHPDLSD
jgi:uncharacterized membrane protein